MALVICYHTTHMIDVIVVVFRGIFLGILFEDFDDFAAADGGLISSMLALVFVADVE